MADKETGRKLPSDAHVVVAVKAKSQAKAQVAEINGRLGDFMADAAEQRGVNPAAVGFVTKLHLMEEFKRKTFLEDVHHYIGAMIRKGEWPAEHFGDLADLAGAVNKSRIAAQKDEDAEIFDGADPDEAAAAANAEKLQGMRKIESADADEGGDEDEADAAELSGDTSEPMGDPMSDEEAGEVVGAATTTERLPVSADDDLPAVAPAAAKPAKGGRKPKAEKATKTKAGGGEGGGAPITNMNEARARLRANRDKKKGVSAGPNPALN